MSSPRFFTNEPSFCDFDRAFAHKRKSVSCHRRLRFRLVPGLSRCRGTRDLEANVAPESCRNEVRFAVAATVLPTRNPSGRGAENERHG